MYSFAQRTDTEVVDEPYYAIYLSRTAVVHPGAAEVLEAQSIDEAAVTKTIFESRKKPVFFVKNMAHHLEVLNKFPLGQCENLFLIRQPRQIIASYAQVVEMPTLRDIGIEFQHRLFERLKGEARTPVVIDSGLLLQYPEIVLKKLCQAVNLQFEEAMLSWRSGPKPYDGVWAPHWYANVHKSTGFERQPTSDRPLPPELESLYKEAMVYYEKLLPFAIRP
jgi:hypothetical protein